MMKKIIFIFVIGFIFQDCSTIKLETNPDKIAPTIVYSKGSCFGKCPIFTLTVYNSGLVKFNGRRYTGMDGKHEMQLDKKKYAEIVNKFRENRFWRFNDTYDMDLVDAAMTTVSFSDKGKNKTVKGKSGFPDKLIELTKELDKLVKDKESWVMVDKPKRANTKEEVIENQIILKTGDGMIMSRWLQEYKKYGLRLMKRIGNDNSTWLVRFDKNKINPKDMLKMIQEDKYISNAEFNVKVTER